MKYKASFTKGINSAIVIIVLYLVIVILLGGNSVSDLIMISVPVIIFGVVYIAALTKGTYVVIENNRIKNYLMFIRKGTADIKTIKRIQRGSIGGMYKALVLAYNDSGKTKTISISILNFKRDTLRQLIFDLRKQNPNIGLDPSEEIV